MKILVVDDEALARDYLSDLVKSLDGPWEVIGQAAGGAEAVARCRELPVDLVLMDIQMPGMSGLEAARRIAAMPLPPAVIFTTAHADHALEAFDLPAAGYLLKPVRPEKLRQALERVQQPTRPLANAVEAPAAAQPWITVPGRGGLARIPLSDVYYFRADHKYVNLRHRGGEALIDQSLRQLEEQLGERVLRIHRNALVVPDKVTGLLRRPGGGAEVSFADIEDRLEVSRRHLPAVRRRLAEE